MKTYLRVNLRYLLIFLVVFFNVAGISNVLANPVSNNEKQYFYVRIFDGFFPIPIDYSIGNFLDSSMEEDLWLSRPTVNYRLLTPEEEDAAVMLDSGSIVVGLLSEKEKIRRDFPGFLVESEVVLYGLNITFLKLDKPHGIGGEVMAVSIDDNKNYVSIVDDNSRLWIELLEEYGRFSGIEKNGERFRRDK